MPVNITAPSLAWARPDSQRAWRQRQVGLLAVHDQVRPGAQWENSESARADGSAIAARTGRSDRRV